MIQVAFEELLEATTPGGACWGVADVKTCLTSCFETAKDGWAVTIRPAAPSAAGTERLMFAV